MKDDWKSPDFFIVGAPKCGTTSLAAYLGEHARICMSEPKEPNYFSTDIHLGLRKFSDYKACFAPDPHDLAIGEASTTTLFSRVAVPSILEFNTKARFIAIVRNPIEMAYSYYFQRLWEGRESAPDFSSAWHWQEIRAQGRRIPFLCKDVPYVYQYREVCSLGEQVERLWKNAGRDRCLVFLTEDLKLRARRTYLEVLDFLQVPDDGRTVFPVHNENKMVRSRWASLSTHLISRIQWQLKLPPIRFGIRNRMLSANTVVDGRPPLDPELRSKMVATFRPDIERLARLLNRDLSHWLVT